ncbi:hypothetical protein F5141DRAFT_1215314 [Pisolithus sp. B1]|nr:hypothetical protein F5141DRAFT_1215314 [Pisolithus sp. B1]
MRAERDRPTPAITCLPRSSVSIHLQKDVDVLLKELKPCMRHLRATLGSYTDELRTLERLYYKNANQHRTALFFKRILETRRYGQRLVALNISEHVDCLYASFFGLTTTLGVNQKPFKGTWTHVPTGTDMSFVLERISVACKLLDKMYNQLMRAYQHFTLAMQSGAFVQLIVLFSALSSRMSTLLSEALQESPSCWFSVFSLDIRLTIGPDERYPQSVRMNTLDATHCYPPDAKTADLRSHLAENTPDRDCRDSPAELDVLPMLDIRTSQHPAQDVVPGDTRETVLRTPRRDAPAGSDLISTAGRRHKAKKVKKKRDEIDEIFSF